MKSNPKFTIIRPDQRSKLSSSMDTDGNKIKGMMKAGKAKAEEYLTERSYKLH